MNEQHTPGKDGRIILTQEQKRIKIAEYCGFVVIENSIGGIHKPDGGDIPDYFNDFNAITEVVETHIHKSGEAICEQWASTLRETLKVSGLINNLFRGYWELGVCLLNATAAQRAEAFGLTLKLWEAGE